MNWNDGSSAENQLSDLYKALGVKNQKDALSAINGLKERVKFTESFDTLKAEADSLSKTISNKKFYFLIAQLQQAAMNADNGFAVEGELIQEAADALLSIY